MKIAVFFQLFMMICLNSFLFGKKLNHLEEEGIFGAVKVKIEQEFLYDDELGKIIKKLQAKNIYHYNRDGFLILWEIYDEANKLVSEIKYSYDSNCNEKERVENNFQDNICWRYQSDYTEKGNKKIEVIYHSKSSVFFEKLVYRYDEKGNEIEVLKYYSDGRLQARLVSEYDENGNKLVWAEYKGDGKLNWKQLYYYDQKENQNVWYDYDGSGKIKEKNIFVLDEKKREKEMIRYNSQGDVEKRIVKNFDKEDRVVEEIIYNNENQMEWKWVTDYFENGKKKEEQEFNADGVLEVKTRWKYDEKGNPVLKEVFERVIDFGEERFRMAGGNEIIYEYWEK